jgi:hypothetical protein
LWIGLSRLHEQLHAGQSRPIHGGRET